MYCASFCRAAASFARIRTALCAENRVPVTSVRYIEEKADRHNIVLGRNPRLLHAVEGLMVWNGW